MARAAHTNGLRIFGDREFEALRARHLRLAKITSLFQAWGDLSKHMGIDRKPHTIAVNVQRFAKFTLLQNVNLAEISRQCALLISLSTPKVLLASARY
jgi:hypothetical protein